MRNKYIGRPVLRTPLIVAGNNEKYIKKAFSSDCDAIVLDLEDGVPEAFKEKARVMIKETLNSSLMDHRPVFVRVNSLETGKTKEDVESVACDNLDGFLYTKPYTAEDIVEFDRIITEAEKDADLKEGSLKIIVIIETPLAVINAYKIAVSSKRIIGLLYGAEDLLGDMEGFHGPDGRSLHMSRAQVLMACRATGLIPIDTPYIQVRNDDGLRKFIKPALELGYEGMLLITPSQIPIVKELYTPPLEKVRDAYEMDKIAKEIYKDGRGVSVQKKLFISPPTLKRARNIIKRYEAIKNFEKYARS